MEYDEAKSALDNKKPLPQDLIEQLLMRGFRTGTTAYLGLHLPIYDRDVDLVLFRENVSAGEENAIRECGEEGGSGENGLSIYVKDSEGQMFNLIILEDFHEYLAWKEATDVMTVIHQMALNPALPHYFERHKDKKVELFRFLKSMFYGGVK